MTDGPEPKKQLGKILLQQKLVTPAELQDLLDAQRRDPGSRLASTATREGAVSVMQALSALSEQHAVPAVDLSTQIVPLDYMKLIAQEIAYEHIVFPFRVEGERVFLAMASPGNRDVIEEVEFLTARSVVPHVALDDMIRRAIDEAYKRQERGESLYVGPNVSDEQLTELGIERPASLFEAAPASVRPAAQAASVEDLVVPGAAAAAPAQRPAPQTSEPPPMDAAFGQRTPPSAPPPARDVTAGKTVLVADADGAARNVLSDLLRERGLVVLEAGTGVEALARVREATLDLLVLDLQLSGINGFEVCRRLRGNDKLARIPVVMLGAAHHDWRMEHDLAEALGVRCFFPRPLPMLRVLRACQYVLAGQPVVHEVEPLSGQAEQLWNSGMQSFEDGRIDNAVESLERALKLEPEAFELHYHLGLLYGRRDDLFNAVMALEHAVRAQPLHFSALKNLAVVYQRVGFRRQAFETWERAQEAAPDDQTRAQIKEHMLSLL
jgi:CheY-like chemotaxis protein